MRKIFPFWNLRRFRNEIGVYICLIVQFGFLIRDRQSQKCNHLFANVFKNLLWALMNKP